MLFELLAAVVLGVGAGGLASAWRRLAMRFAPSLAPPRFVIPATAGLAMVGFAIWSEYSWYARSVSKMPDGFVVATSVAEPSVFRPWTYASPFVSRYAAVDVAGARRNANAPGQLLVDVFLFARYVPTAKMTILVDCAGARRADVSDGAALGEGGAIDEAAWRDVGADDALVKTTCAGS